MSDSIIITGFGERLRGFRTHQNLTQHELARRSGVSANYVAMMERGLQSPSLKILVRLASALHVKVGYLIGE
jgi:transcriptional regulator with XRE-family HTH domain